MSIKMNKRDAIVRTEPQQKDLVVEARAVLATCAPTGKITNGADAYLFDMRAPELLRQLADEVEALRAKLNDPCLVAGYHVCGGKHDLSELGKVDHAKPD